MSKALIVFFDKENAANKDFFRNLKAGRGLFSLIFPPARKSHKGGEIKDTSKHAPKIDIIKTAKILGANIVNPSLIDRISFTNFTLSPEPGTEFREENGKIIFEKDKRLMTFDCNQILQIVNMNTGKPVWERK
jgi:hypothetical protein